MIIPTRSNPVLEVAGFSKFILEIIIYEYLIVHCAGAQIISCSVRE